jgi:uncharacterized protein (DUF1015 family)
MAFVYPFQGFRYNKELVGDLNRVVTQPYDTTTQSMQEEYCRRSPYNVVRITLNPEKQQDADTRYPGAGLAFRQWIDQKVLIQDSAPAFYAYYRDYIFEGEARSQKGLLALLDLDNSASGVLPHEHTLEGPKQDRLRLMRSIEGNEDLIYMLYSDPHRIVDTLMDRCIAGRQSGIEVRDEYGTIHRIWTITDPDALEQIRKAMNPQDFYIADGHHRFETAVNFMNECRQQGWTPAALESFDKRMVTCVNIAGGLTILPTHRLVHNLESFDAPSFLKNADLHFTIERMASASDLWDTMKNERKNHLFGFYPEKSGEFYLLRLKPSAMQDLILLKHTEAYRELDVSILHTLLLERCLGIDESKLAAQKHVDYARDREECIRMVDEGKCQAAFFLNPTTAEQIQRVASFGERMPQKSTDFYPKLLTGLVFMKMRIQKANC